MDLRRLLLTFVGLALLVLILFGVLAHRIARDSADQQQIHTLSLLAQDQAEQIKRWLEQGLSPESIIELKHQYQHAIQFVLLDGQGKILPGSNANEVASSAISAYVYSLHDDVYSGKFSLQDKLYIWVHQRIADENLEFILFIEQQNPANAPILNLGARFLVTGFIVIWIAVWGALILFSHISRKTDKLEAERKRSDEQVRLLLNSTAEAIYGIDAQGNCTFCNPAALQMLGYTCDTDLLGKNIHQLIHDKTNGCEHPTRQYALNDVISEGEGVHVPHDVFRRADGSCFPVEYRGHPIRHADKIVGAVVTFLDISEKLQAEQEMQKLSHVIEQASDAVFITDSDGIIGYVNPAFETITGYRKEEIAGQHFQVLSAAYHKNQPDNQLWRTVMHGEIFSGVRLNTRKDHEEFYSQVVVAPLKDSSGNITHIVFTCRDISVQLEQEAKIQSVIIEKQIAEQASREKSSFLANMSHELRTPLNAIIGYSEILQEECEEEHRLEAVEDLRKIHAAGTHLLALINDILDFSKIEAGKLELQFEDIDVGDMLQEVVHMISPLMQKNRNHFTIQVPDSLGIMHTDVIRLRQCLINLLSNASKFAQGNNVLLCVSQDQRQGDVWLKFAVQDQGIGICEDKVANLFNAFCQADATTTRRFGGTGLGLTISRKLVRMMGGDIEVTSQPGQGSTFTICVPAYTQTRLMQPTANVG
ncbi:MAG: PAS domain S-box protein [Gammaproteobacteria bacterium]|jgi:PAS domain S-box-containing protein